MFFAPVRYFSRSKKIEVGNLYLEFLVGKHDPISPSYTQLAASSGFILFLSSAPRNILCPRYKNKQSRLFADTDFCHFKSLRYTKTSADLVEKIASLTSILFAFSWQND